MTERDNEIEAGLDRVGRRRAFDRAMNVRVGNHIAPEGGPTILRRLQALLRKANKGADPWEVHCAYETLHPYMDGNGRTGRAVWAWMMKSQGRNPFALPFLHRWYYQTLEHIGR